LFVCLPIEIANPADIANAFNYLVDTLAFAGAVMLLAAALPREHGAQFQQSKEVRASWNTYTYAHYCIYIMFYVEHP
jgi:hypothetical protein